MKIILRFVTQPLGYLNQVRMVKLCSLWKIPENSHDYQIINVTKPVINTYLKNINLEMITKLKMIKNVNIR